MFQKIFLQIPFDFECYVCNVLWFLKDLKNVPKKSKCIEMLSKKILKEEGGNFMVIVFLFWLTIKFQVGMSQSNGFQYPIFPHDLPELDLISERLISPTIPFMQLRRLWYALGSNSIVGQINYEYACWY